MLNPTIPSATNSPSLVMDTRRPMMPPSPTFNVRYSSSAISGPHPREKLNCWNKPHSARGFVKSPVTLVEEAMSAEPWNGVWFRYHELY